MKRKGKAGTIFITAGSLLLAAALLLVGYNLVDEYRAGQTANHVMQILQQQMPETPSDGMRMQEDASPKQMELPDYVLNPDMEMPIQEIEGNDYIGLLEIPSLGLSLPVMSEWSYSKLKLAPCCYHGSAYTGSLTIAAHNYRTHFGPVRGAPAGTQVFFTDVKGRRFSYEVSTVETIEATAIEEAVNEAWNLTLITCTPGGQARVAVRCIKID